MGKRGGQKCNNKSDCRSQNTKNWNLDCTKAPGRKGRTCEVDGEKTFWPARTEANPKKNSHRRGTVAKKEWRLGGL